METNRMRVDNTRNERAARMMEKRRAEGWQQFRIWTPPSTPVDRLKTAFPGKQGGINWEEVISAALAHSGQHQGEEQP